MERILLPPLWWHGKSPCSWVAHQLASWRGTQCSAGDRRRSVPFSVLSVGVAAGKQAVAGQTCTAPPLGHTQMQGRTTPYVSPKSVKNTNEPCIAGALAPKHHTPPKLRQEGAQLVSFTHQGCGDKAYSTMRAENWNLQHLQ